jgi:two-component system, OmpR family, sensor histidine kinase KdpD
VLVVIICTLIAWAMFPYFALANLIMVYLVGVMVTAIRFGRGSSILASVLSVAAFDFFYVVPYLTFAVSDTQYVVTFGVMLLVGLTISDIQLYPIWKVLYLGYTTSACLAQPRRS